MFHTCVCPLPPGIFPLLSGTVSNWVLEQDRSLSCLSGLLTSCLLVCHRLENLSIIIIFNSQLLGVFVNPIGLGEEGPVYLSQKHIEQVVFLLALLGKVLVSVLWRNSQ
jgi:hypothetical protein